MDEAVQKEAHQFSGIRNVIIIKTMLFFVYITQIS